MPLRTTVVGSYPKPSYLPTLDWFRNPDMSATMTAYNALDPTSLEKLHEQATKDVLEEQCSLGLDIVTDGELRRENYYLHLCRHFKGVDFQNLKSRVIRNGACTIAVPKVVDRFQCEETFAWKEWKTAQALSSKPVKYTLPGPMTILNSINDEFYPDPRLAAQDLVSILNREILDLVRHGCRNIQLDEPVLVRDTESALDYGIDNAERCFQGCGTNVTKTIHICCGYPSYLDQTDYPKADPDCYQILAGKLDRSIFDCVSLEDAHKNNDLALFQKFKRATVILGVLNICSSRIETSEEISSRVEQILRVIPRERLMLAPDCGLGYIVDDDIRARKLKALVQAASNF